MLCGGNGAPAFGAALIPGPGNPACIALANETVPRDIAKAIATVKQLRFIGRCLLT
jgi:hypothetical protein